MGTTKIFRTKTGFCQVSSDKMVLINEGIRGQLADMVYGESNFRILLFYGLISTVLLGLFAVYINTGKVLLALMALIPGLIVATKMTKYYKTSAEPIIERSQIEKVDFYSSVPILRRAHFVVHFTTRKGQKMKRLILLPGFFRNMNDEANEALEIMYSKDLMN